MDFSFLANPVGVQLPDPVEQFATGLKLSDLARRNRVGALDEEKATRGLAADKAYEAALPDLMQGNFSADAVTSAVQRNPNAAGAILKETDARRKAALDQRKSGAETSKLESETRKIDLAMVGGIAQSIVTNPNAGPRDLETLGGIMKRVGIDPAAFGDPRVDPQAWLRGVAGASIDAAKQLELAGQKETRVEQGRHNAALETNAAGTLAETSRYHAGELGERAATRNQAMTIANMTDQRARDLNQATRDATQGNRVDAQTQALAKFVDSNALPNLLTSANELDATIMKYGKARDMPGIGMIDANVPNWLRSSEGNKVRSQVQAVANDLLKLYSGGAVTANEAERRATEMMASGTFNETDLRNAWPLVKGRIDAATQNARAGFSPEAVQTYESRGGLKLRPIGSKDAGAASSGPLKPNADGSYDYVPGRR